MRACVRACVCLCVCVCVCDCVYIYIHTSYELSGTDLHSRVNTAWSACGAWRPVTSILDAYTNPALPPCVVDGRCRNPLVIFISTHGTSPGSHPIRHCSRKRRHRCDNRRRTLHRHYIGSGNPRMACLTFKQSQTG